jgi:hypothetical protein
MRGDGTNPWTERQPGRSQRLEIRTERSSGARRRSGTRAPADGHRDPRNARLDAPRLRLVTRFLPTPPVGRHGGQLPELLHPGRAAGISRLCSLRGLAGLACRPINPGVGHCPPARQNHPFLPTLASAQRKLHTILPAHGARDKATIPLRSSACLRWTRRRSSASPRLPNSRTVLHRRSIVTRSRDKSPFLRESRAKRFPRLVRLHDSRRHAMSSFDPIHSLVAIECAARYRAAPRRGRRRGEDAVVCSETATRRGSVAR